MHSKHDVTSLIEQVAKLAIENRFSEARELLLSLDLDAIRIEREQLRSRLWSSNQRRSKRPITKTQRKDATTSEKLRAFRRDRFTCRYAHCQRKTIYIEVLKQLSRLFPGQLRRHRNWKPVTDHLLYWVYGTSLEHRLSFPHGGDSSESNMITACYLCNDAKNYLHLDDLEWRIDDPADSDWDGLESLLPALKRTDSDQRDTPQKPDGTSQWTNPTNENTRSLGLSCKAHPQELLAQEEIRVGSLIKACLPDKLTVRAYRVEALRSESLPDDRQSKVRLREMWRTESDRVWVASKHSREFKVTSLSRLHIVALIAPEPGTTDEV